MPRPQPEPIEIYTDGSCRYYKRRELMHGGWAFIVIRDGHEEGNVYESGFSPAPQTNNSMELMAILEALRWIKLNGLRQRPITIFSDSQYCIGGMMSSFRHQIADGLITDAPNAEIWKLLHRHAEACRRLTFKHVKGHTTGIRKNIWNSQCDVLAGKARIDGEKNYERAKIIRPNRSRRGGNGNSKRVSAHRE